MKVGNETFRTKKEYSMRLRALKDMPMGTVFTNDDLMLLIDAEARYDPKQGAHGSAVSFRVGHDIVNGWTSSQCLNVEYEDGHVDVLSYKNAAECFKRPACLRSWTARHARNAILSQIHNFRASHPTGRCYHCDEHGSEVDHMQPTFATLLAAYERDYGVYHSNRECWPQFHEHNSHLQLLCTACHQRKTLSDRIIV
jgi:hypothetical protein